MVVQAHGDLVRGFGWCLAQTMAAYGSDYGVYSLRGYTLTRFQVKSIKVQTRAEELLICTCS